MQESFESASVPRCAPHTVTKAPSCPGICPRDASPFPLLGPLVTSEKNKTGAMADGTGDLLLASALIAANARVGSLRIAPQNAAIRKNLKITQQVVEDEIVFRLRLMIAGIQHILSALKARTPVLKEHSSDPFRKGEVRSPSAKRVREELAEPPRHACGACETWTSSGR